MKIEIEEQELFNLCLGVYMDTSKFSNPVHFSEYINGVIKGLHKTDNTIPKGWYVEEAGQDPLHLLWYVILVNFDDVANCVSSPRHHIVEECDSFEEALSKAIKLINE